MKIIQLIPLLSIVFLSAMQATYLFGQGCSDAGFCTLDAFKPLHNSDNTASANQLKIGVSAGVADHDIAILGQYLEYNRQLTSKTGIDVKLTALNQSGNGISVFGMSDVFFNAHYAMNSRFKLTAGLKIPLANGNRSLDGRPLPMDYQSSLGTYDLIAGVTYELHRWQLAFALQQPLSQNKNAFQAEVYPTTSALSNIASTNGFERSGDVLLRISYPMSVGKKLKFTPGLLPVYHLSNDTYLPQSGVRTAIEGSKGLTLNGNVYLDYSINAQNALQLNAGMPFVVREARPDGLTRAFVVNLEYRRHGF